MIGVGTEAAIGRRTDNRRRIHEKEDAMSTIVVGVDGSEGSVAALRFAIAEARARGSAVKAVTAWHVPLIAHGAADGYAAHVPVRVEPTDYEQAAKETIERTLAAANGDATGVEITSVVRKGQAAEVLDDEAKTADLLVVGSRGRGGFTGLLLGSVSQQCAHHAPCPVVIVPHPHEG
jgi:nucleotide-binding universal stress UspA family protein